MQSKTIITIFYLFFFPCNTAIVFCTFLADLSPLTLPVDVLDKPTKTPERVEFEISFDGAEEESEEEQFEHNLRASLSSDALLDGESSSESDSECFEWVLLDVWII